MSKKKTYFYVFLTVSEMISIVKKPEVQHLVGHLFVGIWLFFSKYNAFFLILFKSH